MITNEYGFENRQHLLLQVLKDVHSILSNNKITYSLCGGTLLGAIRHNGFIPWDDDVDIMLNRECFNKLIHIFNEHGNCLSVSDNMQETKYYLKRSIWVYRICRKNPETYELKTVIDLFVMDNTPDSELVNRFKVLTIKLLQGMMKEQLEFKGKYSLFYKICIFGTYCLGRLFPDELKYTWYEKISQIGNKKRTKHMTGYNDSFELLNLKYSGHLMDKMEMHIFEDVELPITSEYDNYLKTQYGDYMTPPRMEDRVGHSSS